MFDSMASPTHPRTCARARRRRPILRLTAFAVLGAATMVGAGLHAPAATADSTGSAEFVSGPLAQVHGPGTAIVVLGYGLLPDGTMRPELIDRLHAGYVQALLAPASPIIVTGGNPRNGVSEAVVMADWLVRHGIPAHRVHLDPAAVDTVQNAQHSARIMHDIGVTDAVVVTSADHIDRAVASFVAAGVAVAAAVTPDHVPAFAWVFGPMR
ncbi:YdcF family protein [Nocardia cyriacigeorgica]|uniref:YdcF family protein n=2 Tax=Nocardia cyriacigeorgica TaxID=135487 RepID=A0A6P1DBF4_9NOCA|nr:YdcF family protein [Nocardia cyriacigeorgica]NEW48709.1 YdcF family protein [Nocardia cyriacigeorgica]